MVSIVQEYDNRESVNQLKILSLEKELSEVKENHSHKKSNSFNN